MHPDTPTVNPTGFFINPARVGTLTSSAPDTTSSISALREVPFEQLRKGFPRNPLFNIQQARDKLPSRLAQRLASLPAKGNPISTSRIVNTAHFTSCNPIELIGEDFEMDTATGASGTHDIEISPDQIGIEGVSIATVLGVENSEMSIESLKGMVDSTQLSEAEVVNACMQATIDPALKGVLQDLPGSDGLDQLAEAMDRMAHASRLTTMAVDQVLAEPIDSVAKGPDYQSSPHPAQSKPRSAATLPDQIKLPAQHTGAIPKSRGPTPLSPIDDHMLAPHPVTPSRHSEEDELEWIRTNQAIVDRYTTNDLTPVEVITKLRDASATVYKLADAGMPEVTDHITAIKVLERIEATRNEMNNKVIKDIRELKRTQNYPAGLSHKLLCGLSQFLVTYGNYSTKIDYIPLTPSGTMMHTLLLFKWGSDIHRQDHGELKKYLNILHDEVSGKAGGFVDSLKTCFQDLQEQLDHDHAQRLDLNDKMIQITTQLETLTSSVSALTTQVHNLSTIVAQSGFAKQQDAIQTDTRIPRTTIVPPTTSILTPDAPSAEQQLGQLKQALAKDLSAYSSGNAANTESSIMTLLNTKPQYLEYYQALEMECKGLFSIAYLFGINMALNQEQKSKFSRTRSILEPYIDTMPPATKSPIRYILTQFMTPMKTPVSQGAGPAPSAAVTLKPHGTTTSVLTPQPSVIGMSALERRLRAARQ